jgi:hypothetical protein
MKKSVLLLILLSSLALAFFSETKLGAWYTVRHNHTKYDALEGNMDLNELHSGIKVRLIKDDSLADTIVLAPVRVIQLMFLKTPRGPWLVEDENGNRGYVWDNELELIK